MPNNHEKRNRIIRLLYANGHSYGEISRAVNATKNAVVGVIRNRHREIMETKLNATADTFRNETPTKEDEEWLKAHDLPDVPEVDKTNG